jgi:hypothetical protein
MPDKEKYENDVHNCTNPQLADLLDELADDPWALVLHESMKGILRESAKRLRIKQRELFNSEQFNM